MRCMDNNAPQIRDIPINVLVDNAVVGIISVDVNGYIHTVNSFAERLFKYPPNELVGEKIDQLMSPDFFDLSEETSTIDDNGPGGHCSLGRDGYATRKDGTEFPFELGVNQVLIDGQKITVGIIRDISKRVAAERSLLAEKRRLDAVMETVVDGIIILDQDFAIQSFNPSAERIFGYSNEAVIGKNARLLISDKSPIDQYERLLLDLAANNGQSVIQGRDLLAVRSSGVTFPMELGINQMELDGQKLFVATVQDITERKESENAIAEYVELLKRSNKELDEFAYIASHDLKEPLRGLSNNSLFLEEDYAELLDDDGRRRLSRMRYLCDRLEKLIDNLLYFSRLGRQELAVQNVNLNVLVDDVVSLIQGSLDEANVKIRVPEALPVIRCDVPRITEVFRNLITNALKYNDKDDKWIEIGSVKVAIPGQTEVYEDAFYVKDNGIGIDKAFHEAVFRIFKRLNHEKDEAKGTGVGLTFVKKIVERHGGRIWIESELGKGTTFLFTLRNTTTPQQLDNLSEE